MCTASRPAVASLRRKLAAITNATQDIETSRLVMLDFNVKNIKDQNSCVWLIANFNRALWAARKQRETSTMGALLANFKSFEYAKDYVQEIRTDLFAVGKNKAN